MPAAMAASLRRTAVLLAVVASASIARSHGEGDGPPTEEELKQSWDFSGAWRDRQGAKGRLQHETRSSVHHLLHTAGGAAGPLEIPAQVNVVLVGFDGGGGYHYKMDHRALEDLLAARFPATTPAIAGTQRSTHVRHLLNYRVVHAPRSAAATLEAIMRARLRETGEETNLLPAGPPMQPAASGGSTGRVPVFEVDASEVEIGFDAVYGSVLQGDAAAWDRPSPMLSPLATNESAIIIVNFDKLRIDPRLPPPPDDSQAPESLTEAWDAGDLTAEQLRLQEGSYVYRYSYKGAGASASWVARQRYVVIDVSAGPCVFGPASLLPGSGPPGAPAGAVTPFSIPRLQAVLLRSAQAVERQPPGSLRTKAQQEAISVRDSVFRGELAALVYGAVQHVIIPDVQAELSSTTHRAKRILMPLVVLRDHDEFDPLSPRGSGSTAASLGNRRPRSQLDQDAIRDLAKGLIPRGQELVMPAVSLFLHEHRQLATALAKATQPASRDRGPAEVDGVALVDEFRMAADALTIGMWNEMAAEGGVGTTGAETAALLEDTHLVPVFVLSLKSAPRGLSMGGGSFSVSHGGVVIVLQVEQRAFTGHWAGGGPLLSDGLDVTRQVAAGVAQALGGLLPPYARFSGSHAALAGNWLWGVGHHPFGPYSNCTGLSMLMMDAAHRNAILARAGSALGHIRETLELLEGFADEFMAASPMPGGSGYLEEEDMLRAAWARMPWWDSVYRGDSNAPPPVPHATVKQLEENLDTLETAFVFLAQRLWAHDYAGAESQSALLSVQALSLQRWAETALRTAREELGCCRLVHEVPRRISPGLLYVFFLMAAFAVYGIVMWFSASMRQRKFSTLPG